MTNLWLAVLSTVLTLAILGCLWLVHRRLVKVTEDFAHVLRTQVIQAENSLRSHIVDEIDNLEEHVSLTGRALVKSIMFSEENVVGFVKKHADTLHKHAEDLRNHAKELTDRAEVQAAAPRQAVTRN